MAEWQHLDSLKRGPVSDPEEDEGAGGSALKPGYVPDFTYDDTPTAGFFAAGGIGDAWPSGHSFHDTAGNARTDPTTGRTAWVCDDDRVGLSDPFCTAPYYIGPPTVINLADTPVKDADDDILWPVVDFRATPATPEGRVQVDVGATLDGVGFDPVPDFMAVAVGGFTAFYEGAHNGCFIDVADGNTPKGCGNAHFPHPSLTFTIGDPGDDWALGITDVDATSTFFDSYIAPDLNGEVVAVDPEGIYLPPGETVEPAPFEIQVFPEAGWKGIHHCSVAVPDTPANWNGGWILNKRVFDGVIPPVWDGELSEIGQRFLPALWPFGAFSTLTWDHGEGLWYGDFSAAMSVTVFLFWIPQHDPDPTIDGGPLLRGVRLRRRIVGRLIDP